MLDAATAATLDVDALERRPLCCPRLRWWGVNKVAQAGPGRRRRTDDELVPIQSLGDGVVPGEREHRQQPCGLLFGRDLTEST